MKINQYLRMDKNAYLIDKIDITDIDHLKERDYNIRICISTKRYDNSHEEDLFFEIINFDRFKNMLVIRYEYLLSKVYHGLGKGDLVFYDPATTDIYCVEVKSLKDQYSSASDQEKINKCIEQSTKYAQAALYWAGKKGIPVTVIEYADNSLIMEEKRTYNLKLPRSQDQFNEVKQDQFNEVKQNQFNEVKQNQFNEVKQNQDQLDDSDKTLNPNQISDHSQDPDNSQVQISSQDPTSNWFTHPGDQTDTVYKISGNTLVAKRTIDYEPSAGSRKSFRKRVQKVAAENTRCEQYDIIMQLKSGEIVMSETRKLTDIIDD
jgi:hypothetical protein